MSEGRTIVLLNAQQGHTAMTSLIWPWCKAMLMASRRVQLSAKPATRSIQQNSRLWAMLADVSEQVEWYGRKLSPEDWKHVFSAALSKQDVVPGIDGGFVVLGKSTSKMTTREMSDLQTLIEAFGADKGVRFSAPAETIGG